MDISSRLIKIVEMVPMSDTVADIGTDHGYVLIELLKRKKIKRGIASDNKEMPLEKARKNAVAENVENSMDFRLGSGFKTLKEGEVNGAVIAGMGGILIRELLENDMDVIKHLDFILLQPAQNPEILRKYLYQHHYRILEEELVREDRRFYEYLMVKYDPVESEPLVNHLDYVVGDLLLKKQHPLLKDYLTSKIKELEEIKEKINLTSVNAKRKSDDIILKIKELRSVRDGSDG
ncbi:tRNA (adenine(22)-N(1))-methyltransferase [Proteiniclasticum sp. C24MP]|uniref:tRNA (adenine(22)-N(1))-methyltransferase n=1 Tax=Proteiniclasticum sp. C24MP TaxID=3374101 RepID=UPI0037544293